MVCICLYTYTNVLCGNDLDGLTLAVSLRNSEKENTTRKNMA